MTRINEDKRTSSQKIVYNSTINIHEKAAGAAAAKKAYDHNGLLGSFSISFKQKMSGE